MRQDAARVNRVSSEFEANRYKGSPISSTDFEFSCFEADRNVVVRQLKAVGNAIEDGASEMKLIGLEKVFDERLSKVLTGEARTLQRIARELNELRREVARARFPQTKTSTTGRGRRA
jgi:hypothetical protein